MEDNLKQGFCIYCGCKVLNEQSISGSVTIDRRPDVVNLLKVAKEALTEHDWSSAARMIENIFMIDADCQDAWNMKALLSIRNRSVYEDIFMKIRSKKLNNYNQFSEGDIKKYWGEHTVRFKLKKNLGISKMEAQITMDNKETCYTELNGDGAVFGVNPGKHDVSVSIDVVDTGIHYSSTGRLSFVSTKDHEFILRVGQVIFTKVKFKQMN